MPRVMIQLTDELFDLYLSRAKTRKTTVPRLLIDELKAIKHLDVSNDRVIVIDPQNRQRLETLLGEGHIQSAADLTDRLERLLSIRIGGIDLDFTPSQRHELVELAARNSCTPEVLFRSTVKAMEELFFSHAYDQASKISETQRNGDQTSDQTPAANVIHAGDFEVIHAGDLKPEPELVADQTNAEGETDGTPSIPPSPKPTMTQRIREAVLGGKD